MARRLRIVGLLIVWVGMASCVIPKGEYRAGVFLHQAPNYSFRLPEGWRPARASDSGVLGFAEPYRKVFAESTLEQFLAARLALYDASLVSPGGAFVAVARTAPLPPNVRLAPGAVLPEALKPAAWEFAVKELVRTTPGTSPRDFQQEEITLRQYGANTGLVVQYQYRQISWTQVEFPGPGYSVAFLHAGSMSDRNLDREGFESILRSFRFD